MPDNTVDFLNGQIYVMKRRLAKAQRRIERSGEAGNKVEEERAHRLAKLIEVHEKDPVTALDLYK